MPLSTFIGAMKEGNWGSLDGCFLDEREERKREGEEERDRQAWDPVHFGQGELAEKQAESKSVGGRVLEKLPDRRWKVERITGDGMQERGIVLWSSRKINQKCLEHQERGWGYRKLGGDKQNDSMNKKHKVVRNPMFTIAKKRKQRKCPSTEDWIKKIWYIYIQLNIVVGGVELLSYVLLFATS